MAYTMSTLLIAITLAGIVSITAYYNKWLDAGGACVAAVMGAIVWMAGGWGTAMPMLLFFISGSLFSKLQKNRMSAASEKQSNPRDFIQVLCNGGIAVFCLLLWMIEKKNEWLVGYFLSLSVSTADTWSSELGMKWGGKVVDIIGLRPLPTGISGGISWQGSGFGLVGSLLIGMVGFWLFKLTIFQSIAIIAGGFTGMLLDSTLGSTLQARYRLNNGEMSEFVKHNENGRLEKGFAWMTNDLVNLLSNFIITAIGVTLLMMV